MNDKQRFVRNFQDENTTTGISLRQFAHDNNISFVVGVRNTNNDYSKKNPLAIYFVLV